MQAVVVTIFLATGLNVIPIIGLFKNVHVILTSDYVAYLNIVLVVEVTSQKGMLTPPLILLRVYSRVC
jgi:hypothetical protein